MYILPQISVNAFDVTTQQIDAHGNVVVTYKRPSNSQRFYVKKNYVWLGNAIVERYKIDKSFVNITLQYPKYYYKHNQVFSLSEDDSFRLRKFLENYFPQNAGGC